MRQFVRSYMFGNIFIDCTMFLKKKTTQPKIWITTKNHFKIIQIFSQFDEKYILHIFHKI